MFTVIVRYNGKAIGFVDTNRSLTTEEAADLAGIDLDAMIDDTTPMYVPELLETEYTQYLSEAERVAAMLGNDGQNWETDDGKTLDELAEERGAYEDRHPEKHHLTRYIFDDGSAIVTCEGAWDIEGAKPWSWQCEE